MKVIEVRKKDSAKNGLYSLVHFEPNHPILKFEGGLLNSEDVTKLEQKEVDNLLQIGKDLYLNLKGDISYFINHSCNANSKIKIVGKNAFIISTRAIVPNEEISFDYATTSTDDQDSWKMDCDCKAWNCRKSISGFNTLTDKDKSFFKDIVPKYIMKTNIGNK